MTETKTKIDVVFDATMLDTFLLCPQKYYLRHKLNRVTPILARPLDKGQLVHHGLENYFEEVKKSTPFSEAADAMIQSVNVKSTESDLSDDDVVRVKEVLLETCRVNQALDYSYEILAVEQSFMYVLYEDDFIRLIMIGKIDLLVNDHIRGYLNLPIDHKSYERDFPVHRKTNQFCNYTVACNSNYLLVNRIGFQTSIKPEVKHKRVPLSYDPDFHQQWRENVVRWVNFYLECEGTNSFPLNDTSCDKFNRLCEYYSVCDSSGQEAKTFKLNTNFKVAPVWDVSKSLGSKE